MPEITANNTKKEETQKAAPAPAPDVLPRDNLVDPLSAPSAAPAPAVKKPEAAPQA